MLNILKNRFEQGCKTSKYPKASVELVDRYRGLPEIKKDASAKIAEKCAAACPQDAINAEKRTIDMGKCVFCGNCERVSEGNFVRFTTCFETSRFHARTSDN